MCDPWRWHLSFAPAAKYYWVSTRTASDPECWFSSLKVDLQLWITEAFILPEIPLLGGHKRSVPRYFIVPSPDLARSVIWPDDIANSGPDFLALQRHSGMLQDWSKRCLAATALANHLLLVVNLGVWIFSKFPGSCLDRNSGRPFLLIARLDMFFELWPLHWASDVFIIKHMQVISQLTNWQCAKEV